MNIRWDGLEEFKARLSKLPARAVTEAKYALSAEGEDIMTDSKNNYVPVDLGPLRASGHVWPAEAHGTKVTVDLSYGGDAAAYALAVHEHPSVHSPPSWSGEVKFSPAGHGPKYLEKPMRSAAKGFGSRLAKRIDLAP